MPYKDLEARRAYAREWVAKRRADWVKDKSCVDCGSTENLELDHVDPETKISHRIWSWSDVRRNAELAKCVVRCQPCHLSKSRKFDWKKAEHGSLAMYSKHKCRCAECRQRKYVERRDYEIRKKARQGGVV